MTYREAPATPCHCDRPSIASCVACGAVMCAKHQRGELCIKCDQAMREHLAKPRPLTMFAVIFATAGVLGGISLAWPIFAFAVPFIMIPVMLGTTRIENRLRRDRYLRSARRGVLLP